MEGPIGTDIGCPLAQPCTSARGPVKITDVRSRYSERAPTRGTAITGFRFQMRQASVCSHNRNDEGLSGHYMAGMREGMAGLAGRRPARSAHRSAGEEAAGWPQCPRSRAGLEVLLGSCQYPGEHRQRCRQCAVGPCRQARWAASAQADGRARPREGLRVLHKNMGQPRDYAEHALACKAKGYPAYKILRTISGTPTRARPLRHINIRADIRLSTRRDAVDPTIR